MDGDSWLSWLSLVLLLLIAMYFAMAETAAATVGRIRLRTRLEQGDQRAKKALYIQDHFEQAISTILIGTNITHISAATLVTLLVTRTWGAFVPMRRKRRSSTCIPRRATKPLSASSEIAIS